VVAQSWTTAQSHIHEHFIPPQKRQLKLPQSKAGFVWSAVTSVAAFEASRNTSVRERELQRHSDPPTLVSSRCHDQQGRR
jgi:hypothetical protein